MFDTDEYMQLCIRPNTIYIYIKVSPDESTFDMPNAVFVGKIGLYNQTSVVQLQKYQNTFFLVFFVSRLIVKNGVAFIQFCKPLVEKMLQYINTYTCLLLVLIKGKLVMVF